MSDKHESILHELADALIDYFDETGAVNYIEQTFECKEDSSKSFVLTMQKTEGLTPCQKLAVANEEIKKLQAENAELKKQGQWISVDITDVKIGSILTYRNGKDSIVYDVSDAVNDGINGGVAQCRIWANVIGGKGVYHTYRKDGVSHYESGYDIVKITPPEGE
jgi:hypothetical protein